MSQYEDIARRCLDACGGLSNIQSLSQCVTRFRIVVKDESKVDEEQIRSIPLVKGLAKGGGQHQIVFGPGVVTKVFKAAEKIAHEGGAGNLSSSVQTQGGSFIQKVSGLFGDIFVPVLPAIISAGMLSGIRALLVYLNLISTDSSWYTVLSILCSTVFDMMPVLVTWSSCKKFGGTPALGIVLGIMLVSTSLPGGAAVARGEAEPLLIDLFGLEVGIAGFQGSVLVALAAGWIVANLENIFRDYVVPNIVDQIFTPLLAVSITFLLTMFLFGPLLRAVENGFVELYSIFINMPFGIGGFCIAFLQQFIVITGCHHALNIIDIRYLAETGLNPMSVMRSTAVLGQCGACAAFIFRSKTKQERASAVTNTLAAAMGITEPAIFAQTLPSKGMAAFICGAIGGGIGGWFGSLMGIQGTGMGVFAIPGITLFLAGGLGYYLISCAITMVVSFGLTYIVLGRQQKAEANNV